MCSWLSHLTGLCSIVHLASAYVNRGGQPKKKLRISLLFPPAQEMAPRIARGVPVDDRATVLLVFGADTSRLTSRSRAAHIYHLLNMNPDVIPPDAVTLPELSSDTSRSGCTGTTRVQDRFPSQPGGGVIRGATDMVEHKVLEVDLSWDPHSKLLAQTVDSEQGEFLSEWQPVCPRTADTEADIGRWMIVSPSLMHMDVRPSPDGIIRWEWMAEVNGDGSEMRVKVLWWKGTQPIGMKLRVRGNLHGTLMSAHIGGNLETQTG